MILVRIPSVIHAALTINFYYVFCLQGCCSVYLTARSVPPSLNTSERPSQACYKNYRPKISNIGWACVSRWEAFVHSMCFQLRKKSCAVLGNEPHTSWKLPSSLSFISAHYMSIWFTLLWFGKNKMHILLRDTDVIFLLVLFCRSSEANPRRSVCWRIGKWMWHVLS